MERIHHVLGDMLRTFDIENEENVDENDPFTGFLAAAAYAIRTTYHTTL